MADASCLDMVGQRLVAESVSLMVRYTKDAADRPRGNYDPADPRNYTIDARGTVRFPEATNARAIIMPLIVDLFEQIVDRERTVHNMMLNFNNVMPEGEGQLSLFVDEEETVEERARQEAILDVKRKFGKNALLKGIDLMPQATQRDRNRQIGGHKSGE